MPQPLRVAFLWSRLSSCMSSCFAALRDEGAEIYLAYEAANSEAPFDDGPLAGGFRGHRWTSAPDEPLLRHEIADFNPDALVVCSWNFGAYRRIARSWRNRTLRVLCMDNPWLGTAKQWAGRVVSTFLLAPTYDVAFLPGERQAEFARRLGFRDDQLLWGLYCCDDTFARAPDEGPRSLPRQFLYVGRLVPDKGIDVLAAAYREYRASVQQPWPLLVCGTGDLARDLQQPGIEHMGFVQPNELIKAYEDSGCLVLPSRFEPWGLVMHEAASAGLALIASTACGASTRFLLDGYNGVVVPTNSVTGLTHALRRISSAPPEELAAMGVRSRQLAEQITPKRWATYLIEKIGLHRADLGLT